MSRKLIARPRTIDVAIQATSAKINSGYKKGMQFFDLPDNQQLVITAALSELRHSEKSVLETLKSVRALGK